MSRMRLAALTGGLVGLMAGSALAQGGGSSGVSIAPLIGYIKYDEGAALDNAAYIGLSAMFNVSGGFAAGAYVEAGRPTTIGDYFPAALMRTGGVSGTTQLSFVSQRVVEISAGGQASYTFNLGGASLALIGGLGRWNVSPDVEQSKSAGNFGGTEWIAGAALGFKLGAATSVLLDLRSVRYLNYERSHLNPVSPAYQNTLYPDFNRYPNEPRHECADQACGMSNWRFGIGFVFHPGGGI